jgi:hypothetical protein
MAREESERFTHRKRENEENNNRERERENENKRERECVRRTRAEVKFDFTLSPFCPALPWRPLLSVLHVVPLRLCVVVILCWRLGDAWS